MPVCFRISKEARGKVFGHEAREVMGHIMQGCLAKEVAVSEGHWP